MDCEGGFMNRDNKERRSNSELAAEEKQQMGLKKIIKQRKQQRKWDGLKADERCTVMKLSWVEDGCGVTQQWAFVLRLYQLDGLSVGFSSSFRSLQRLCKQSFCHSDVSLPPLFTNTIKLALRWCDGREVLKKRVRLFQSAGSISFMRLAGEALICLQVPLKMCRVIRDFYMHPFKRCSSSLGN